MKILPVGVQSFDMMRQEDYIYVDKTRYIFDLISGRRGRYFFLSRPRRFGKSLLVSTLKELFEGKKELFEGLWISTTDYTWQKHPVIFLDFSTIASGTPEQLYTHLGSHLNRIGSSYGIDVSNMSIVEDKFQSIVAHLADGPRVVILIDEYDKPLLEHVSDVEAIRKIQAILRSFYAAIKGASGRVQFLFMTGVTKFSKTSVFSGMNNLIDLTLSEEEAALLGYTDEEIDIYFQPYMQEIAMRQNVSKDDIKDTMKHWYNGYQFSKNPLTVYNPFSVLMYLLTKDLRNYWFETGTPSFLVNLIQERKYKIEDLEQAEINIDKLASFDIDKMKLVPLLMQTGYLTIKGFSPDTRNYQLGYPNEETKASFLLYFMEMIIAIETEQTKNVVSRLIQALNKSDLELFFNTLSIFFASIPYNIQLSHEQYYQSIFYVLLSLIGADIHVEVVTNNGRIDCTILTSAQIYIFEFKLHDTAEAALAQIEEKKYYQKFLHEDKVIILIGVAFDMKQRTIGKWLCREYQKA